MTNPKSILACLLLSWALFAGACLGPSTQPTAGAPDDLTQGSFGYRFGSEEQVARGRDDEPATLPGPDGGAGLPPQNSAGDDLPWEPAAPSLTPVSPADEVLALQEPPQERVPGVTPLPYPEEWLSPPPRRGFFESGERVVILLALAVIAFVAGIGVLRNW